MKKIFHHQLSKYNFPFPLTGVGFLQLGVGKTWMTTPL